jgi:hypothetical protein
MRFFFLILIAIVAISTASIFIKLCDAPALIIAAYRCRIGFGLPLSGFPKTFLRLFFIHLSLALPPGRNSSTDRSYHLQLGAEIPACDNGSSHHPWRADWIDNSGLLHSGRRTNILEDFGRPFDPLRNSRRGNKETLNLSIFFQIRIKMVRGRYDRWAAGTSSMSVFAFGHAFGYYSL